MAEYTNYVWEFYVKNSSGVKETVGVKAVAIDDSLLSTGIPTTGDGTAKLVDEADVITYISNKIKDNISTILTTEDYTIPSVKAVQDFIKSQSHITIKKVDTLPTTGESNVIYLVPKTSSKTGNKFDEYIWQDNVWELIGDTQIPLDDYVQFTDFAKTDKGGVIKSSTADGKISVDSTTGIASLNGYDNLAKLSDLDDYYKMTEAEKTAGTSTLLSAEDKTKLDGIATEATKTTIAKEEVVAVGTKITITNQTSTQTEADSIEFTIPKGAEPAYNKVIVNDSEASASNGQTIKFISSDSIRAETDTDTAGNPTIKFEVAAEKREIFAGDGIKLEEGPDPAGGTEVGLIISVDSEYKPKTPTYNNGCITF